MANPSTADRDQRASIVAIPNPVRVAQVLPTPLTSFVGREHEVAAIAELLRADGTRLVTLTGPGGVGKTRLALRVAAGALNEFPDGAWFVSLAPITDPKLVVPSIAQALGVREAGGERLAARVAAFLAEKRSLLILDNMEQVVESSPQLVEVLQTCPRLTILATSRMRMRVSGEYEWAVAPLAHADSDQPGGSSTVHRSDAVELFVARARSVRADFALTHANAPTVTEICRRLDGLPLAIELAVARTRTLSPDELLRRLDSRLPLLANGPRDAPARHRTMRSALAWSYDLLTVEERAFFCAVSVFAGGFTREAADFVARETDGEPPSHATLDAPFDGDRIESLVEQSLLHRTATAGGASRFGMLETIREFGLERLMAAGRVDEFRRRHADWLLSRLEAHRGDRATTLEPEIDPFVDEHANVRLALHWSIGRGDRATAGFLAWGLAPFWFRHGLHAEARRTLSDVLRMESPLDDSVRASLVRCAAMAAWCQSDFAEARVLAASALDICRRLGDRAGAAANLQLLAIGLLPEDPCSAVTFQEESVAMHRELGDHAALAHALFCLGCVAMYLGDTTRAAVHFGEAETIARDHGRHTGPSGHLGLAGLAWVARVDGDVNAAERYAREALGLARAQGDLFQQISVGRCLGTVFLQRGDWRAAAAHLQAALHLADQSGTLHQGCYCLYEIAAVMQASGEPERAARLLGAESVLRERLGLVNTPDERAIRVEAQRAAKAAAGDSAFVDAWESGRSLSPAAAFAEALAWSPCDGPNHLDSAKLTARELEVLRLVAQGWSNREIAGVLYISVPTVKRHLTTIFGKLGTPTREAAAERARSHGLA